MPTVAITDPAEWHKLRARNIGGSEVAALFGVQAEYAMSHYALWQVKSGRLSAPEVTDERAAWGLRLEAAIAEAAAQQEGWTIRRGGYITHPRVAGMGCTLDYEILAGERGRDAPGCLEVKNVDWLIHRQQWTDQEPPPHILMQLQHQLACTTHQWGAVAACVGGNRLAIYRYQARAKTVGEIEKRVDAFWRSIAEKKPPRPDGSGSTSDALHRIFPGRDAPPADLTDDNELPELCATLLSANATRDKAEKQAAEARNRILEKVGDHPKAYCEGFRINAPAIDETPEAVITADMVGQPIPGRKAYRQVRIKELT